MRIGAIFTTRGAIPYASVGIKPPKGPGFLLAWLIAITIGILGAIIWGWL